MVQFLVVVTFSVLAAVSAQMSPYAVSSDPGVLPQYQPEGTENRFGEGQPSVNNQMHAGTLQTEDLFNRVSEWPEDRKPFWYLNRAAIQKERERQQEQQQQQRAVRNRRPSSASRF